MMHLTEIAVLLAVVLATVSYASSKKEEIDWGYNKDYNKAEVYKNVLKEAKWSEKFKECKGKAQSPINIEPKKAKKSKLGPLKVKFEPKGKYFNGSLVNNGHAPTFTLDKKSGNATVKFDKKDYILEKFLFHYGCENDRGSEHTVDKKAFAGEIHMVFYNKKYKEFKKAVKEKDGLLIIATFIEKDKNPYSPQYVAEMLKFSPLNVVSTMEKDQNLEFGYLELQKMVPSLETGKASFYTYKGSLTTPGCFESVRWIVVKEPITMSQYMMSWIRTMKSRGELLYGYYAMNLVKMCDNFRPVQKLEDRKVEFYEAKKKN